MKIGQNRSLLEPSDTAAVLVCMGFIVGTVVLALLGAVAIVAGLVVTALAFPIAHIGHWVLLAWDVLVLWWRRT